jgi:signal transduction histidine kinase
MTRAVFRSLKWPQKVRLLADFIFISDPIRLTLDSLLLIVFGGISYLYKNSSSKTRVSYIFGGVIHAWLFYSGNYFGRDGLTVLLLFCSAPYAYYVIGTEKKLLFYLWLALPCVNLILLEFGDYSYFPNNRYIAKNYEWSRMIIVMTALVILVSVMYYSRLELIQRDNNLIQAKDGLKKMLHRVEMLTESKERYNTLLRQDLQDLVEDHKNIKIKSGLEALRSEERERSRITQELIDGLGGHILAMKYRFETYYPLIEPNKLEQYKGVVQLIDTALTELYRTCGHLHSEQFKQLGLLEALRGLYKKMETSYHMRIHFSNDGYSDQLNGEQELIVYRMMVLMIEGALENTKAGQCNIEIKYVSGGLYVSQWEDGIEQGNNSDEITDRVRRLREMVALLGGHLRFKSVTGKGANAALFIPVAETPSV